MNFDQLYIGGRWVDARGDLFGVEDPSTGEVVATCVAASHDDVDAAVDAARLAMDEWSTAPPDHRVRQLQHLGRQLADRADELSVTITTELGMPLAQVRQVQVGWPVRTCLGVGKAMEELAQSLPNELGQRLDLVPAGVAALITPWNFPLHQLVGKVVSALAAGCTVVCKPSELTPLDAITLAEEIDKLALPPGTFNLVQGGGDVGAWLAAQPVDVISVTGSTATGIKVIHAAAHTLARVCLELGGKSPSIVLPGADLEQAVLSTAESCWFNSGQCCNALSLLWVPRDRVTYAEELAMQAAADAKVGDPRAHDTQYGPLISADQRRRAQECVNVALEEGAEGTFLPGPVEADGYYMAPTVLSGVVPGMEIARTEVFGPVLSIVAYDPGQLGQVVAETNDSPYGLYAAVWGEPAVAESVARNLRVGQVELNGVQPLPSAPFGGFRASGIGRERGVYGLREFLEPRVIAGIR